MPKCDYWPVPFVDTANLSWKEKFEYRKHGVSDRDMQDVMETSKYKTVLRLFQNKMSRRPLEELNGSVAERIQREAAEGSPLPPMFGVQELVIDPGVDMILKAELAQAAEPVMARRFSTLMGFPVYRDETMYAHPDFPYLLVEPNYYAITPDPNTGEVNRRTLLFCHYISNWSKEAILDEPMYAHQVRASYAMNIMNADDAYIVYMFDNTDEAFTPFYCPRNPSFEAEMLSHGKNFWLDYVEKEILPMPTIPSDIALKELAPFGYYDKPYRPRSQLYTQELAELVPQYTALYAQRTEQKEALDETEQQLLALKMQMATQMLGQREAECGDVRMKWRLNTSRSCNFDGLKQAHPHIYAQFVKENRKPAFDVRMKKSATNTIEKEAA